MSAIYDNWERLVAAVLRKQQLWELFHDHSRSPSILSEASSSSFNSSSPLHDLVLDFSRLGSMLRSRKATPRLALVSDFSSAFDVEDVFLASAALLGRGTFGSTYTVAMENGVKIVLKRLKSTNISEQEFKSQMEIVGSVRHENVAALRAYYSSEDERLMLYDYYSDGSVHALLHGRSGRNKSHVDWETRRRIAIGAARGIAAIHAQNGGKLVHGNIKASNIFLNSQKYGCVSHIGLATMVETIFMPTAGYSAPEVKNVRDISQAADVYSFGILLLELLTRKSPVHAPGGPQSVDLVKLVNSVKSKERAAKVFDSELLTYPTIREQAVIMLQIGITCTAKSTKKRPKMLEVVRMLEDINTMNRGSTANPQNQVSLKRKLVFVEDANPKFELEDLLRASAEVLGKGISGTSYKARLENGNTVVVKRLKDVMVTFEVFQQHMNVIGKMRHENVHKPRAYYFSRDEKLVVYDYYEKQSLSDLLHKKGVLGWTPLDWETRLKVAVGAARGIAHIHRQDGEKLVHGNMKSSNIFLDGQRYGIVSDAGLAKLLTPMSWWGMRASDYHAPEVADTRQVSQASDVYSFGILLLELVTGRKSSRTFTDDFDFIPLVNWIQSVVREEWTPEVIDVELLRHSGEEEAMVQVLQIGLECAVNDPKHRPRMPQVVRMLEEISGIEPSDESGLEDRWEQPSIESRLEDLLDDLLPTLIL
ncbi:putative inactive receptor kinase [Sesamum alatum]|uniref:Inactive receptor kinase n=1 Tax=Sesamum alatum TaxID=300844 RepID=A0AAE2CRB0_9LAMI|nr:putative inactive receptor kinase [Sesamum alatum]